MLSLLLYGFQSDRDRLKSKPPNPDVPYHTITHDDATTDFFYYPTRMDALKTARGVPHINSAQLPHMQNTDFHRTTAPWILTKPYTDSYRMHKRRLLIDTATHERLDHMLNNPKNGFVGDWHASHPDMVRLIQESLDQISKPPMATHGRRNTDDGSAIYG